MVGVERITDHIWLCSDGELRRKEVVPHGGDTDCFRTLRRSGKCCEKSVHFAQYIGLVRVEDEVVSVWQADDAGGGNAGFECIGLGRCGGEVVGLHRSLCGGIVLEHWAVQHWAEIVWNCENCENRDMDRRVLLFSGYDRHGNCRWRALSWRWSGHRGHLLLCFVKVFFQLRHTDLQAAGIASGP